MGGGGGGGGGARCTQPYIPAILPSVFSTSLATMLAILSPFLLCIIPDKSSVANECMPCTSSLEDVCCVCAFRSVNAPKTVALAL